MIFQVTRRLLGSFRYPGDMQEPQENAIQPLPFLSSSPPNSLPFGSPTKGLTFTWSQHRQDTSQPKGNGLARGGKHSLQNVPISPVSSPGLCCHSKSGGCTGTFSKHCQLLHSRHPTPFKPDRCHRGPTVAHPLDRHEVCRSLGKGYGWRDGGSGLAHWRLSCS